MLTRRSLLRLGGFQLLIGGAYQQGMAARLLESVRSGPEPVGGLALAPLGYAIKDVAHEAGLEFVQVCGGDSAKKYILETTGSGVAFIDYDKDGWLDVFLVNGSRLQDFAPGQNPSNQLFHNNRDGTFTKVTREPAYRVPVGDRASVSEIMTTTGMKIFS